MEYLIFSLTLVVIAHTTDDHRRLTAVSYFDTLTHLYRNMRNDHKPSDEGVANLPSKKKTICGDITNSHYFSQMQIEHVDPERIIKKLRQPLHKITFRELFQKNSKVVDASVTDISTPASGYTYTNKYTVTRLNLEPAHVIDEVFDMNPPTSSRAMDNVDVSQLGGRSNLQRPNDEHLFVCLTKKRSTPTHYSNLELQKWYVSKEYEMSAVQDSTRTIVGRFVFKKEDTTFKLVALAEEAALPYFLQDLHQEDFYVNTLRMEREPEKERHMNPLCRLISEPDRHKRLCTAVFSSSIFVNEMMETAETKQLVESKCSSLEVTFRLPMIRAQVGTKKYFEWMVPCKAQLFFNKEIVQYNISWAYKPNSVIIFDANSAEGQIVVYNICGNVIIPG